MSYSAVNGDQPKWEPEGQDFQFSAHSAQECYSNTTFPEQPSQHETGVFDAGESQPDSEHHHNHHNHYQHTFHCIDTSTMYHFNGPGYPADQHNGQEEESKAQFTEQEESNGQTPEQGRQHSQHSEREGNDVPYMHAGLDGMMANQLGLTPRLPSNAYPSYAHMAPYNFHSNTNQYHNFQGFQSPQGYEISPASASTNSNSPLSMQGPQYSSTPQSMQGPRFSNSPQYMQGYNYSDSPQYSYRTGYSNTALPISPASTDRDNSYRHLRPHPGAHLEPQGTQATGPTEANFITPRNFGSTRSSTDPAHNGNEGGDGGEAESDIESEDEPPKRAVKSRSRPTKVSTPATKKHHNEVEKSYRVRLNGFIDELQVTVFGPAPESSDEEAKGKKSKFPND